MRRLTHGRALRAGALGLALAAASVVAFRSAHAEGDADAERQRLEEKRGELADRLTRLDRVAAAHGLYVRMRDGDLLGEGGVAAKATAFFGDATAWVSDWTVTLTLLDRAGDLAGSDARRDLLGRIREHAANLETLRARAYELATASAALATRAQRVPALGRNTTPAYAAQTELLDRQREKLAEASALSGALATRDVLQRWASLSSLSERLVRLRVSQALATSPELDSVLRDVDAMYRADEKAAPLVASVYAEYTRVRDAVHDYRPFAAETHKARLLELAAQARQALSAPGLDPRYTRDPLATIDRWRDAGEGLYDEGIAPYPPSLLVAMRIGDTGAPLAATCRDTTRRLTVNCELFEQAYRVPRERVEAMTDAELRYLEGVLDKVREPAPLRPAAL